MRERKAEGYRAILPPALAALASICACQIPTFAISVALEGHSGAGQVSASTPDPCELDVDFGSVSIGQEANAIVAVVNRSSHALTLLPFSPDLDPEFDLSIPTAGPPSIPAGKTLGLTLGFQVYRAGAASSTFSIPIGAPPGVCQSPSGAAFTVKLTGNGIAYRLVLSPPVLDLGPAVVNTTVTQTAMLTNRSATALDGITAAVVGSDPGQFLVGSVPIWLDAGQSVPIDVTFTPLPIGASSSASITFDSPSGAAASLTLVGRQVATSLVLAPSTIDFGHVIRPATAVACTTVSNQANATVTIGGITDFVDDLGAFTPAAGTTPPSATSLPVTLASGSSAELCFDFSPAEPRQYQGQATLVTDDPGANDPIISLSGWGQGPEIRCAPSSLSFGSVLDGTAEVLPVTCTNVGTAQLGINLSISPLVSNSTAFSARFDPASDPDPLAGLDPGESARIDVEYWPIGSASDQGTLILKNNGGQGSPVRIPLTGQALDLAPCQFAISPATLDFGNVAVGRSSIPLAFAIGNQGPDACIVSGLTIGNDLPGNFHVLSTSIPAGSDGSVAIPGLSSLTVNLQFSPMLGGDFSAEAKFSITNPSEPNQIVPLSGSSQATCLVMTPPSLDFGDVGVNDAGVFCTSAGRSFTIYNACATPATLQGFTLQFGPGDSLAQFSTPAGPRIPAAIGPGSSVAFQLQFDPTVLGSHSAQLLASDGTVEALLPLSGAAVDASTETDSSVVGPPKVDILFVVDVDDDGAELTSIIEQIPSFLESGAEFDYRIAVTTDNDYRSDALADLWTAAAVPHLLAGRAVFHHHLTLERAGRRHVAGPDHRLAGSAKRRAHGPVPDGNPGRRALLPQPLQRPAARPPAGRQFLPFRRLLRRRHRQRRQRGRREPARRRKSRPELVCGFLRGLFPGIVPLQLELHQPHADPYGNWPVQASRSPTGHPGDGLGDRRSGGQHRGPILGLGLQLDLGSGAAGQQLPTADRISLRGAKRDRRHQGRTGCPATRRAWPEQLDLRAEPQRDRLLVQRSGQDRRSGHGHVSDWLPVGLRRGRSLAVLDVHRDLPGVRDREQQLAGGRGATLEIPLAGQGLAAPPCQFVVAPSQINFGDVSVGATSPALSFEIQNVGVSTCLVQGLENLADSPFVVVSTSIAPDPVTGGFVIPAPAPGVVSTLTVEVELVCATAGTFSIQPSDGGLAFTCTGTCG